MTLRERRRGGSAATMLFTSGVPPALTARCERGRPVPLQSTTPFPDMRLSPVSFSAVALCLAAGTLPHALQAQVTVDSSAPAPQSGAGWVRMSVTPQARAVHPAPVGARPVTQDAEPRAGRTAPDQSGPGAWIGGAGGCRTVVPRWTALGAVLGFATPLALRAVGSERANGKDVATSTGIGAVAGVFTGALLCRQARAG